MSLEESTAALSGIPDPRSFGLIRAAYSVNDTLGLLSIGRTSLYELVKSGDLPAVKLGRKTLFYAPDIAALLARLKQDRK
jgi:excisionase family DNA binding protein